MSSNKKGKLVNLKRVTIALLFLAGLFLFEPTFRDQLTFAFTYIDHPKIASDSIKANYYSEPSASTTTHTQQKSHAPEPSTLFLILSGMGGIIVRFARKRFEEFKRVSDIILSIVGLTIASPVLIFVALLIKLESRGPVIYRQNRVGKNGKVFKIYKLRTMRLDAEKYTGAVWAREDDPRITPLGRILRKTHIDEIPQLFNVIKGEMSIVGPRPERPEIVRDLKAVICDYEKRLKVKPGITGLAQVHHKYDETIADVKKKIKYDLLYIRKMCWLVEMRILARTFVVALTGKGAR
jgi:lipopolysaccharide/colanic/teichoic acid biosynthesis glycosyltransferase